MPHAHRRHLAAYDSERKAADSAERARQAGLTFCPRCERKDCIDSDGQPGRSLTFRCHNCSHTWLPVASRY